MNMYVKKGIALFLLLQVFAAGSYGFTPGRQRNEADSIRRIMQRVVNWQWQELETNGWKNDQKDWTNGAMYAGMVAWAGTVNDATCFQKLEKVANDNHWQIGPNRHFADDYCIGRLYAQLYERNRQPQYLADFKSLADTLLTLPHTDSLLWVNSIYLREWAWCDALFMGPPALAYLSKATGDSRYLDMASRLWWKTSDYLYDARQHLFYRDSRYFTKKEKNGKNVFWSRGNGWVLGGLVAMLSVMPEKHPDRKRFVKQYQQMCASIAALQQPDGTWHASLLDPESYPSKEVSGTAFFCYALAWGIHHNILSDKTYRGVTDKAWQALTSSVHENGKLGYVQPQGAAPEKVTADDTEVYGVGAFLLAGTEMLALQNRK